MNHEVVKCLNGGEGGVVEGDGGCCELVVDQDVKKAVSVINAEVYVRRA
jgi:hypothetical protein